MHPYLNGATEPLRNGGNYQTRFRRERRLHHGVPIYGEALRRCRCRLLMCYSLGLAQHTTGNMNQSEDHRSKRCTKVRSTTGAIAAQYINGVSSYSPGSNMNRRATAPLFGEQRMNHSEKSIEAEQRLKDLKIDLPAPPKPLGAYVESVQSGELLFLSGTLPIEDGTSRFYGRIGDD